MFVFKEQNKEGLIQRLSLPSIKELALKKEGSEIHLSWNPIESLRTDVTLLGYNIYQFCPSSFIPRSPLNDIPLQQAFFIDSSPEIDSPLYYIVRGVFDYKKTGYLGPSSNVVCTTS